MGSSLQSVAVRGPHGSVLVTTVMPGHPDKLDMLMLNMQASLLRIQPKLKPVIKHLRRKINKLNCLHIDSHRQRKSFQKTRRDQGVSWCRLAYWEERVRVGAQHFSVSPTSRYSPVRPPPTPLLTVTAS